MTRGPILLVDDDDNCVKMLSVAMEKLGTGNRLAIARDGEEALAYLKGEGEFADREKHPFPLLILLDLRMPRMDGLQVLQWIRKESPFWWLPVIVLTISESDRDMWEAYRAGATSFMIKGNCLEDLMAELKSVLDHWGNFSVHPSSED
jgi:CheY-like chemotaxis protein